MCMCSVAQSCLTLCDIMDYSPPGSFVQGIFRQEYWKGLPFPSPGDLSNPRTETVYLELAGRFFTTEPPGKPESDYTCFQRPQWLVNVSNREQVPPTGPVISQISYKCF